MREGKSTWLRSRRRYEIRDIASEKSIDLRSTVAPSTNAGRNAEHYRSVGQAPKFLHDVRATTGIVQSTDIRKADFKGASPYSLTGFRRRATTKRHSGFIPQARLPKNPRKTAAT